MTICVLIRSTTFHNKSGGLETQNKTLCEGFVKKGHKVVVISTSTPSHLEGGAKEEGVQYVFTDAPAGVYSKKWWEDSVNKFSKLNKEYKFDVVISQSSAGKAVFPKVSNGKKIAICHGTALGELKTRVKSIKSLRNMARFIFKDISMVVSGYYDDLQIFRNADKVVCVSDILSTNLIKEYPFIKSKAVVIDNGVDEGKFKTQNSKLKIENTKHSFALLYVGRVVEEKGIGELLKALAIVKNDICGIFLYVVGGGKDLDRFKILTNELKIKDVVNYVGEVENTEVTRYYQKADVFVYPSVRQEGFPMVLAEAMFSRVPIIASRIGGIPSVIEDDKTGFLIAPRNVQSLVLAIKKFYSNPPFGKNIAQNAYIRAAKSYSQEAMVEKYLNLC